MIHITFKPDTFELEIEGHANHGIKGEDIVCAAISTLFYTLGQTLFESKDMLESEPVFKDKDGKGFLACKPKSKYLGNIARSYQTILLGMQMVENNYKNSVKLNVVG